MTRILRDFINLLRHGTATEQHIREEISKESFPYVVEYIVAREFAFPQNFDCRNFRGLRYCQLLANSKETAAEPALRAKLVTFWRDRETFDRQAAAFAKELGEPSLFWQGYQDRVQAREKPRWWKKTGAVWLLVVHAVAVLGTIDALRRYYAELFQRADVQLYAREAQYDLLQGQPFQITYKVRNVGAAKTALSLASPSAIRVGRNNRSDLQDQLWDCALTPAAPTAHQTDPGLAFRDQPGKIPEISLGEVEEISISGLAQSEGRYCIVINGKAESGSLARLFVGDSNFQTALKIRVWSRLGIHVQPVRAEADKCHYMVEASPGVPFAEGVGLGAELAGVTGAQFRFVRGLQVAALGQPHFVWTPGTEVTGIEWLSYPLPAMKDVTFALELQKPGATQQLCNDVGHQIKIRTFGAQEFNR